MDKEVISGCVAWVGSNISFIQSELSVNQTSQTVYYILSIILLGINIYLIVKKIVNDSKKKERDG